MIENESNLIENGNQPMQIVILLFLFLPCAWKMPPPPPQTGNYLLLYLLFSVLIICFKYYCCCCCCCCCVDVDAAGLVVAVCAGLCVGAGVVDLAVGEVTLVGFYFCWCGCCCC